MLPGIHSILANSCANTAVGFIGAGHRNRLSRVFVAAGLRVVEFEVSPADLWRSSTVESQQNCSTEIITDLTRLAEPDVLVVCVPMGLTPARGADTDAFATAAQVIGKQLRAGQLVILTGAISPGTTRRFFLPSLTDSRLVVGENLFLAYSSSPMVHGNSIAVGGWNAASAQAVAILFERAGFKANLVSSLETAEVCGVIDSLHAAVRNATANELKIACGRMGINPSEVMAASGADTVAPTLGNCDPAPLLLAWGARQWDASVRLVELAVEINAGMPAYVVDKVTDALNDAGKPVKGSRIAILGLVPQKNSNLSRSPSCELMERLFKKGAVVSYNDPHILSLSQMQQWPHVPAMESQLLTAEYLMGQDCILIAVDHIEYASDFLVQHSRLIVDTCNAMRDVSAGRDKIVKV